MTPLRYAKRLALAALARTPMHRLFQPLTRGQVPIFMLHRFADHERGSPGHDPRALRRNLFWLRDNGFQVLGLLEAISLLSETPEVVGKSVVLTVDDGYDDFRRVGWPVFQEAGVPVTVFTTTGFVDGSMWFWWDRIEHALSLSPRHDLTLESTAYRIAWTDPSSLRPAADGLIEHLKRVEESARLDALTELGRLCEVEWPERPPDRYAALTWDAMRDLERSGATFGPHSVTHPILSRTTDDQSAREITGSWARLLSELTGPVPVFCYPNGRPEDFGDREVATLREARFEAALATGAGYVTTHDLDPLGRRRYSLPRYPWPDGLDHLVQIVAGVERAKTVLRGAVRA